MIAWTDVLIDAAVLVLLPVALAALVALPFWARRRILIGNALGSAVIGVWMIVIIIQRFSVYFVEPSIDAGAILTPLLLPAIVGWVDVLILFFLSGIVEERAKKRYINPDDF